MYYAQDGSERLVYLLGTYDISSTSSPSRQAEGSRPWANTGGGGRGPSCIHTKQDA